MEPRFSELAKVRVTREDFGKFEGYVIDSLFRQGRWVYKVSISENQKNRRLLTTGFLRIVWRKFNDGIPNLYCEQGKIERCFKIDR